LEESRSEGWSELRAAISLIQNMSNYTPKYNKEKSNDNKDSAKFFRQVQPTSIAESKYNILSLE